MRQNQIKWGAMLSYVLIVLNTLYGLLLTPFILGHLGQSSYGVYKTITSMSSSLAVVDLGLGVTMTRYMAGFNAKGDKAGAGNFAAMLMIQQGIISAVIMVIGAVAFFALPAVYGGTFTAQELDLAKKLFLILVLNLLLRLFEGLLTGIVNGHEHFVFANGIKLTSLILRFSLLFLLLPIFSSPLLIVLLETGICLVLIGITAVYVVRKVGIRPRLIHWDKAIFKESLGYTLLMFVQTITIQFNGNVDNILIGAKLGVTSVTVYSVALTIFGMYESLSGSLANIMLPNMAKRVAQGQTPAQLQAGVEKAGRFQFLLLAAALGGFVVLGKDFYRLWLGEGFEDCYLLTLILIVPVTFPMMQNVALSILRAQNKMRYRTVTLLISCGVNITVSFVGLELWGYWGAALGTACATFFNLLFMNWYYHKHLKFKIFRLFGNVMNRTWLCAAVAAVATGVLHHWYSGTWLSFIVNAGVFLGIYGILLLSWGMEKEEKTLLIGRFARKTK